MANKNFFIFFSATVLLLVLVSLAAAASDSANVNLIVTKSSSAGGGGGGPISGCTDPSATNYNNQATIDNGSCLYSVPNVGNFIATAAAPVINLTWTNPGFPRFNAVRIVRQVGTIATNPTDGVLVYDGGGESAVDVAVSPDTVYFYTAFVRDIAGTYSSGVVASATIISGLSSSSSSSSSSGAGSSSGGLGTSSGGGGGIDPFALFPETVSANPLIQELSLRDFIFIQPSELVKTVNANGLVRIRGDKSLTIFLPYDRVPEMLKTIGITLALPNNPRATFSFLLRVNPEKTGYLGTIAPLGKNGNYAVTVHIINYRDQSMKRLQGTIIAAGALAFPPAVAQMIQNVVTPIAIIAGLSAGTSELLAITANVRSFIDLYFLFLRGLGALLGLLGIKRKSKPWGTVYDAVTKRPIDPAYVTVQMNGREVTSAITDIDGRYGFFLAPGQYLIKVGKTHYHFPSATLAGKINDELYNNLYFGEPFESKGEEVVAKNVPLDPEGFDWNEFIKSKKDFFKLHSRRELLRARVANSLYGIGLVAAVGSAVLTPGWFNFGVLLLYVAINAAQRVWQFRHPVFALKRVDGEVLSFAVIRVFLPEINQEIKRLITDELGRFYLLVRPGRYYYTVEEKLADKSYQKIYQSPTVELKRGVLAEDIVIPIQ